MAGPAVVPESEFDLLSWRAAGRRTLAPPLLRTANPVSSVMQFGYFLVMENVYPPPWKFLCKIKQIPTDGWGLGVIIATLAYHPMNQKMPTEV